MFADGYSQLREGLVYLVALILSITVHEFGHAIVADKLGDGLPRAEGRVTLNPVSHVDPIGTLLLPAIAFVTALSSPGLSARILGWGRPVRLGGMRHRAGGLSPKGARLLIALAGPGMNLCFGLVLSVLYLALLRFGGAPTLSLAMGVASIVGMNIGLAFFNLIPCPPLDGSAILLGVLPRRFEHVGVTLERYGFLILFALLMTGMLSYFMIPARIVAGLWLSTITGWASL